jgi:hypothetical protein
MTDQTKVFFQIEQDEDGYPGIASESVWAKSIPGNAFQLDNIPFFATSATLGDVVRTRTEDGHLWFEAIVQPSGHSLFRVVFFDVYAKDRVNRELVELGCQTEYLEQHHLLAVSIPDAATVPAVQHYLEQESVTGSVDYEEAILRD